MTDITPMCARFRGFLPIVVDVETGGFNEATDALLQIAAVIIDMDEAGQLYCAETVSCHVTPFEGARLDPASMLINGIDVDHPFRLALDEKQALPKIFNPVREHESGCCSEVALPDAVFRIAVFVEHIRPQ